MADPTPADPVAAALAHIRAVTDAATRGPWEAEDDEDCWRLFGAITPSLHPLQLIKAPKHGTPYAEYWPNEADAAFIVAARSRVPRLLAALEAGLTVHPPQVTANGKPVCPNCTRDMSVFVPADRCLIRMAISRKLLGTGEGHDGNRS